MSATNPSVGDTPCPACGSKALRIEQRLRAKPIDSFSLSGVQMKVSAESWPCDNCGIEAAAKGGNSVE